MKGGFDAFELWPLYKMVQNWLVDRSTAPNFTLCKIRVFDRFQEWNDSKFRLFCPVCIALDQQPLCFFYFNGPKLNSRPVYCSRLYSMFKKGYFSKFRLFYPVCIALDQQPLCSVEFHLRATSYLATNQWNEQSLYHLSSTSSQYSMIQLAWELFLRMMAWSC